MLRHTHATPVTPSRVVVLGSAGFVGSASTKRLAADGIPVLALPRQALDLLSTDAADRLAEILRPDDVLLIASVKARTKDNGMLIDNLRMMDAICVALAEAPVAHLVHISSDAVYADSDRPLTESSPAQPTTLYGIMHLAREVMLANAWNRPVCVLRPSMLYGFDDPHNGYGPNRFNRLAAAGKDIVLFGQGEERRDHVFIDDLVEIIRRVVVYRSRGLLNVVTGRVSSFREIAEMIVSLSGETAAITTIPRQGAVPFSGYRAFDASATVQAFPDFSYTPLEQGLAHVHNQAVSAEDPVSAPSRQTQVLPIC